MRILFLSLFVCLSFLHADITKFFPQLSARVVDEVGIFSPEIKNKIEEELKNEEDESSNQIVVVVLKTLHGYEIADFTYQLGRHWQIGQKDKNNGVILLIAPHEKKMRLEVGYGLEGALNDKISFDILEYTLKPYFQKNDFENGIFQAIKEIRKAIKGEFEAKGANAKDDEIDMIEIFMILSMISIFLMAFAQNSENLTFYKISKSTLLSSFAGTFVLPLSDIFICIFVFIIIFIVSFLRIKQIEKIDNQSSSSDYDRIFSSRNGHFSSFGSSSFSGGGGSFGGGGASSSW